MTKYNKRPTFLTNFHYKLIIIRILNIEMSELKKILPKFLVKNIFNKNSNSANTNHEDCPGEFWCKECVPSCLIEGWSSGNSEIDKFIKDTIYNAKEYYNFDGINGYYPLFLEWVPFDRFEDIKQIGEGGFAKVYSAKWIDGRALYENQDDGTWKKLDPEPINVALERLNGSQNMSAQYLNEVFKLYNFCLIIWITIIHINLHKFDVNYSLKHIGRFI